MKTILALFLFYHFYFLDIKAGPWQVPQGELKFFLEYTSENNRRAYDAQGETIKPVGRIADIYIKEKREGKLFIEYGIIPTITTLFTFEGGEAISFVAHTNYRWVRSVAGVRASYQLEESTSVVAFEANYGYQILWRRQDDTKSQLQGHLISLAVELGKSWEFFDNNVNPYVTSKLLWQKSFIPGRNDQLVSNNVFGLELRKNLLSRRFIILTEFIYKRELEIHPAQQTEEYQVQGSVVFFPVDAWGIELGYRHTIAGRNISTSSAVFTKLWLIY